MHHLHRMNLQLMKTRYLCPWGHQTSQSLIQGALRPQQRVRPAVCEPAYTGTLLRCHDPCTGQ